MTPPAGSRQMRILRKQSSPLLIFSRRRDGNMQIVQVTAKDLLESLRWRVEIFTDDNSHNLTSQWPSVPLAELVEESTVASEPDDYDYDQFYYVGLENVEPVTGDTVDLAMCRKGDVKSRSKVFSEGCVLYGRLRPYLRKVFLADTLYPNGLCSTEFIVMKPDTKKIQPLVLRALLASEAVAKQLSRLQIGAALPRVLARDFLRTTVPLPPLDVQARLATRLEQLRVERLRLKKRLEEIPREIDQ